jgi:predicted TIM-barrel fold metal-dependent hydrolase
LVFGCKAGLRFTDRIGDVRSAVATIEESRADRVIVANLLDTLAPGVDPGRDLIEFNEWLGDLAAADGRFVPLAAVDPRYLPMDELLDHLDALVARGFVGVKIHPPLQNLDLSSGDADRLLDHCERNNLVVLSHSGPDRVGSGRGEPNAFRPVLNRHPGLRLVLAHLGGAAWRQAADLARDYPSVAFDLCEIVMWVGAPNAPSRLDMVELIRSCGIDRVMMGSDFPWYDIEATIEAVESLGLTRSELERILGRNAVSIFRLSDTGVSVRAAG